MHLPKWYKMDNRNYSGRDSNPVFKRQWPMRYRSAKYCPLAKSCKMKNNSERGDWEIRNLFLGHPRPTCYRSVNVLSVRLAELPFSLKRSSAINNNCGKHSVLFSLSQEFSPHKYIRVERKRGVGKIAYQGSLIIDWIISHDLAKNISSVDYLS